MFTTLLLGAVRPIWEKFHNAHMCENTDSGADKYNVRNLGDMELESVVELQSIAQLSVNF